jgi:hypothetical protein
VISFDSLSRCGLDNANPERWGVCYSRVERNMDHRKLSREMRMGVGLHALECKLHFSSVTPIVIFGFCYSLVSCSIISHLHIGHWDTMRTFRSLFHLPPLLLLFSFAIAAPVELDLELLQLTPDNFKSSIANGVW